MMSLRAQLDSSCGLPSADQMEKFRFVVSTARAHLLCFARPRGDQAMAIGALLEISSPTEYMDNGAISLFGNSSYVNNGT